MTKSLLFWHYAVPELKSWDESAWTVLWNSEHGMRCINRSHVGLWSDLPAVIQVASGIRTCVLHTVWGSNFQDMWTNWNKPRRLIFREGCVPKCVKNNFKTMLKTQKGNGKEYLLSKCHVLSTPMTLRFTSNTAKTQVSHLLYRRGNQGSKTPSSLPREALPGFLNPFFPPGLLSHNIHRHQALQIQQIQNWIHFPLALHFIHIYKIQKIYFR